jgi:hypothetical protein
MTVSWMKREGNEGDSLVIYEDGNPVALFESGVGAGYGPIDIVCTFDCRPICQRYEHCTFKGMKIWG